MKFAIVIASYNEGPDLLATVALARASRGGIPSQIIVVDDSSRDPVAPMPDTQVVRTPVQLGSSGAKRLGMSLVRGDIDVAVVLDSHMRMPYDWLDLAARWINEYPDSIFCTACRGFDRKGFMAAGAEFKDDRYDVSWLPRGDEKVCDTVPCLLGACYFLPMDIYRSVGGWNRFMTGWGWEEQDLSIKAWTHGYSVRRMNDLIVAHRFDRDPVSRPLPNWHTEFNAAVVKYCNTTDGSEPSFVHPESASKWNQFKGAINCERLAQMERRKHHDDSCIPRSGSNAIKAVSRSVVRRPARDLEALMGLAHREAIVKALPLDGTMLEWGCGGTTRWLRKQGVKLTSIEHDDYWARVVGGVWRVDIGQIPIATPQEEEIDIDDSVNPYLLAAKEQYDVILVDGVLRNRCLKRAAQILKPNGRVFLHDFQRDWYEEGKKLFKWEELPSCDDYPGPTMGVGTLL